MGFLDKIKNALFEVEYVEVEEPPKKEKKVREEKKEEKPVAKKIVLPGKKEEKVEELHEEELRDEDFEIRPKDEPLKARTREEFKIMNDNDFKVDEDFDVGEPEIVQVLEDEQTTSKEEELLPKEEEVHDIYVDRVESTYREPVPMPRESKPYGVDHSYSVPVHPYGTYEKKEEKTYFRPSPIISPIYGILDKNYKKEDVKEKREVHISSYTRTNMSVDDIRNKAYGKKQEKKEEEIKAVSEPVVEEKTKFEVEELADEENVLVDLSDRAKPEVKEITMGDAVEYFQDLGLEYNVDYVDTSTDRNNTRKEDPVSKKEEVKKESSKEKEEELELTKDLENTMELGPVEKVTETREEVRKRKEDPVGDDTDDNLFDLIDSMYPEND